MNVQMQLAQRVAVKVTSSSGTGSTLLSAVNGGLKVTGLLYAVKVDYSGSAPGTTDVIITESGGLGQAILTLSNQNTDVVRYPRATAHKVADGTAVSSTDSELILLADSDILVSVTDGGSVADVVTVTFYFLV